MATLNFTQAGENVNNSKPWPIIGKMWPLKKGNGYSVVFGNRVRKEKGNADSELQEAFENVVIKPGDRAVIQENQFKNDEKQPSHIIKLVPADDEQ